MSKSISKVKLNAKPEKVWEALTRADLVKKWQYGSDLITNWKVGETIKFHSEWNGNVYEQHGTVLEVKPYELISYSLFAPRPGIEDIPENYFTMIYNLQPFNNGTALTITQVDNRQTQNAAAETEEDNTILLALKEIVENGF